MQHDVDYAVCTGGMEVEPPWDVKKCKNRADRKMVQSSDAIP